MLPQGIAREIMHRPCITLYCIAYRSTFPCDDLGQGPLLIALDLEGEVHACGSASSVGLETPLADVSSSSLQVRDTCVQAAAAALMLFAGAAAGGA
jgi:hypothetical protein